MRRSACLLVPFMALVGAFLRPSNLWQRSSSLWAESNDAQQRSALREELMSCCDGKQGDARVQEVLDRLIPLSPPMEPLLNWKGRRDVVEATNALHGLWMVRFTSDPTSSLNQLGHRGPATAMRFVNASDGTWTEIVEYRTHAGKLKGFRLVSRCTPVSTPQQLQLQLQRDKLVVDRRSRVGLGVITLPLSLPLSLPLPPHLLRLLPLQLPADPSEPLGRPASQAPAPAPAPAPQGGTRLSLQYLDEDLCVYTVQPSSSSRTGTGSGSGSGQAGRDGHVFVLARLYDAWDPAVGWTTISAI